MQEWRVTWWFAAKAVLLSLPLREAARVDAAVLYFARSGVGDVEWIQGDPNGARLRVPPRYVLHVELDWDERILRVWSLRR